jgi:DNA-binding NarL/FixJ family response regulator
VGSGVRRGQGHDPGTGRRVRPLRERVRYPQIRYDRAIFGWCATAQPHPREKEVAILVAKQLTNRQIATELSICEHTAATHVRRILKKLGLQSRAQIGSWLAEQQPPTADLN